MFRPLLALALSALCLGAAAAGTHAVVLKDGTRIECTEPPLIALGRVLYRTADGARHAVPVDRVDLEKTKPQQNPGTPVDAPKVVREPGARPAAPSASPAAAPTPATARRAALDFTAKGHDGKPVKLSELKGKVVLVDFWATWCGPCVAEMPNVKRVYDKFKGKDFEIVGVSLDRSRVELDAYLKAQGIQWPQAFDGKMWENAVARQYGVASIPAMLLVDRKGRIARVNVRGPMLEPAIAELLAEK